MAEWGGTLYSKCFSWNMKVKNGGFFTLNSLLPFPVF